jgi:HAD superfamily hydrolase (TIGR01509 family)
MSMGARFQVILFDVDDTLFDRELAQRRVAGQIADRFADLFAGMERDQVVCAFMESDRIATQRFEATGAVDAARAGRMEVFLDLLGLKKERAGELTAMYIASYPRIEAAIAGARPVVAALYKRFRLGVVSNGISDVQYQKLETLGIRCRFECILLSEELGIRKPDPRIFRQAAEILAVEPRECLYVGDSYESDVLGAQEAGMQACWFNPRRLPPPRGGALPAFEVASLAEILDLLDAVQVPGECS